MELDSSRSHWKIYLAIGSIIIVGISILYTNYLTNRLAQEEANKVRLWIMAQTMINDVDDEEDEVCDFTMHYEIIRSNLSIPVIVVNDRGGIDDAINFGEEKEKDTGYLLREVEKLKNKGFEPIQGFEGVQIFYKESFILTLLRYFPIFQFTLISIFIFFGYLGFSSARRAEQNRVWVGMAKETAHQLGTPISAILAWIEHLKMIQEDDEETMEVVHELRNDVHRLELIAERFSKIGSEPKLEPINVYEELDKCRDYMEKRASRKVRFEFPGIYHDPVFAQLNPPLFDWVIENLLRNALDALEGEGLISARIYEESGMINIDIKDTGKGIPASKFKTVFKPGYTTKKRGWGLGLSLAKRIVEQYHSGKIFVKESAENEGTTFTIQLPKK